MTQLNNVSKHDPEKNHNNAMKFNHIGIPVTGSFEGEIDLPHLKMTVSDHENNRYGIQWQRYWENAPYPELVKTVPHVAFIDVNGAPVELMEYSHSDKEAPG